ncbi:MAG: S1 RNA-binding domain-containing protein, partial [Clostridia bacterium]|nr:S1 RNA-binding domain-containing protein [Clostridia bacterium]
MNSELFTALDLLEKEKGISKEYMIEKLTAALTNAYKREHGGATNVRVLLDPAKKEMKVFRQRTVVEEVEDSENQISLEEAQALSKKYVLGTIVENEVKTDKFSRLAAQAGKQVIIQAIREAERMIVTRKYENSKEEIITATVYKVDETDGSLVIDTGTSHAVLTKAEQIPGDSFKVGDRLKVYVTEVRSGETRGPIVSLSRVHPGLVRRLFELQ